MKVDGSHPQVARLDRTKPPPGWHDPPGLSVFTDSSGLAWYFARPHDCALNTRPHLSRGAARAAAWAWYWRRVAVAARVEAEVVVLVEHNGAGTKNRVPTLRVSVADALRPMLTMADDEDARQETVSEVERLFSEGRLMFEGDHPIELSAVDTWPRCLAWSDEQVAEVERWLAEGGEPPEVLR